jgi:hypothetical protein
MGGASARATDEPALVPEAVTGWRMWRLERGPDGCLLLRSLFKGAAWPARDALRARCNRSIALHARHQVPERSCSCGIYAAASYRRLRTAGVIDGGAPAVLGTVSMWGRVVEHAGGYRAELAYPSRLLLACARCVAAGRTPVPDLVLEQGHVLIPVCRAHARLAPGRPGRRSPAEIQAELLSRYAVDPLPLEAARLPVLSRLPDPARMLLERTSSVGRTLKRTSPRWLWVLAVVLFLWMNRPDTTVPGPTHVGPAQGPAPLVAPLPGPDDPPRRPAAIALKRRLPSMALVCGDLEGEVVTHAPRCRPGSTLLGFAERPPAGRRGCVGDGYTRKRRFSVCWLSLDGPVDPYPHPAVWRMPGVRFETVFREREAG